MREGDEFSVLGLATLWKMLRSRSMQIIGGSTSGYRFPDLDPFKRRIDARLKSITLPLVVRASLSTSSFAKLTSSAERAMPSISDISIQAGYASERSALCVFVMRSA